MKFTVLIDEQESRFSGDELQALCYRLSHCGSICPLATSLPTPVHLADREAEKAKCMWLSEGQLKREEEKHPACVSSSGISK